VRGAATVMFALAASCTKPAPPSNAMELHLRSIDVTGVTVDCTLYPSDGGKLIAKMTISNGTNKPIIVYSNRTLTHIEQREAELLILHGPTQSIRSSELHYQSFPPAGGFVTIDPDAVIEVHDGIHILSVDTERETIDLAGHSSLSSAPQPVRCAVAYWTDKPHLASTNLVSTEAVTIGWSSTQQMR